MRFILVGCQILLVPSIALSQVYDRFNSISNICESANPGSPPRRPTMIKDFPKIDRNFLISNPICANKFTCLTPERIARLTTLGALPDKSNTLNFLNSDFAKKAQSTCEQSYPSSEFKSVHELGVDLQVMNRVFPNETKIAVAVVQDTKAIVDNYLQDSALALRALRNCLEINISYVDSQVPVDQRAKKYKDDLKTNSNLQRGCERIWEPDGEIAQIRHQLVRMRQAIFAYNRLTKGSSADHSDLSPAKSGLSKLGLDSFWKNTPDKLEPATNFEKEHLSEYYADVQKRFGAGEMKDAVMADYLLTISENPILVHFSSARPTDREMLAAFDIYSKKLVNLSDKDLNGIEYLEFSTAMSEVIRRQPEALAGDSCILAEHLLNQLHSYKSNKDLYLQSLILLEGGIAATAAKGVMKKALALVFKAPYSGTTLAITKLKQSYSGYQDQMAKCSKTFQGAEGLCRLADMEKQQIDYAVGLGLLLVYGRGMALPAAAAATLKGDTAL